MNLKKVIAIVVILIIYGSGVSGTSYLYNPKDKYITDNSSISTIAQENAPTFTFQSQAQYLIEPTTNTVLYANNENERLLPASVTKVMSLLLIMQQIDSGKLAYTDMIKCSEKASHMGGSQIWFKQGEELSVEDCLKAICIVSANDYNVQFRHDQNTTKNLIS